MDFKNIREQFPIYDNIPNLVYLDSGATALKPKCVLDKMNEYYSTYGVNIHRGVYSLSYQATDEYDKARQIVAEFINSDFKEVVFTKNVSDALNKICLMLEHKLSLDDAMKVKASMSFETLTEMFDSIFMDPEFTDERRFIAVMNFFGDDTKEDSEAREFYLAMLDNDAKEKRGRKIWKKLSKIMPVRLRNIENNLRLILVRN